MISVSSSNIRSIGYDDRTSTLTVEFRGNSLYEYYNVPQYVFEAFRRAGSKGTFHADHIKDNFNYRKIR